MSRPPGTLGFITAPDCWDRLAVETDTGTYYMPNWHRPDDWHYCPGASFREWDGTHGPWCDMAEADTLCADCARQAHPDRDEVA